MENKKRNIIVIVIVFLIMISILVMLINPSFVKGGDYCERVFDSSGSIDDPLEIGNVNQLECYQNYPNSSAVLTSDITLNKSTSQNSFPIAKEKQYNGTTPIGGQYAQYKGSLDGQNHTIRNVYINDSYPIIPVNNGTIENIVLKNVTYEQIIPVETGILSGTNDGKIKNVYIEGSISNSGYGGDIVGGIVGDNNGNITESSTKVDMDVPNSTKVGGIAGWNFGRINKSYAKGDVNGKGSVGGLVGANHGLVYQSYATGDVTGNGGWVIGGLIGENTELVYQSYAAGDVNGDRNIGGLIGDNGHRIGNTYAKGNVNGDTHVGGLIGTGGGEVKDTYVTGEITGDEHTGAIIGFGGVQTQDVYWDVESTGIVPSDTKVNLDGNNIYIDNNSGTPLRTSQMIGEDAKTNMTGLNFSDNWRTVFDDYPKLYWEE